MKFTYTVNYFIPGRGIRTGGKDIIVEASTENDSLIKLINIIKNDSSIGEIYEIIMEEND